MADTLSKWKLDYSTKARKQKKTLPQKIQDLMDVLAKEIEEYGPLRANWPNFGPLKKSKDIPDGSYHCHIKKGKPTYVACWCVENKKINFVEVYYVGTHEKAPY